MEEKRIYKILFIERDSVYARLIRNMLAENGGASLKLEFSQWPLTKPERLATEGVDLILLDLGLPDSQGFDTLSKAHAQAPDVAVVVLASLDDESMEIKAAEAGAQDYLVKKRATGNVIARSILYAIERKRMEKRTKQLQQYLELQIERMPIGLIVWDRGFHVQSWNPAAEKIFGFTEKESLGKHPYDLVVLKEAQPHVDNIWRRLLEGDTTAHSINENITKDGRTIICQWSNTPLKEADGPVAGVLSMVQDITERKRMEEQLIVADRLASIGELVSGIAHELNNPLTSVIGFSELLLEKDVPDDVRKGLKIINREAQRTAQVVRNLLTFARKHPEEKQPVSINKVVQELLELRAYEQKVNNIQANTHFAADLPEIIADGFQLHQVFTNIIINAEYFMIEAHGRGNLTITTERIGDVIHVSFADDGPGIAKENLGHLFDPFFTTKEVGKGTGLGLSICHGILTAHGGKIYAESELGKGATFVVELPVPTPDKGGTIK